MNCSLATYRFILFAPTAGVHNEERASQSLREAPSWENRPQPPGAGNLGRTSPPRHDSDVDSEGPSSKGKSPQTRRHRYLPESSDDDSVEHKFEEPLHPEFETMNVRDDATFGEPLDPGFEEALDDRAQSHPSGSVSSDRRSPRGETSDEEEKEREEKPRVRIVKLGKRTFELDLWREPTAEEKDELVKFGHPEWKTVMGHLRSTNGKPLYESADEKHFAQMCDNDRERCRAVLEDWLAKSRLNRVGGLYDAFKAAGLGRAAERLLRKCS